MMMMMMMIIIIIIIIKSRHWNTLSDMAWIRRKDEVWKRIERGWFFFIVKVGSGSTGRGRGSNSKSEVHQLQFYGEIL